jgi:hypothetical protein
LGLRQLVGVEVAAELQPVVVAAEVVVDLLLPAVVAAGSAQRRAAGWWWLGGKVVLTLVLGWVLGWVLLLHFCRAAAGQPVLRASPAWQTALPLLALQAVPRLLLARHVLLPLPRALQGALLQELPQHVLRTAQRYQQVRCMSLKPPLGPRHCCPAKMPGTAPAPLEACWTCQPAAAAPMLLQLRHALPRPAAPG